MFNIIIHKEQVFDKASFVNPFELRKLKGFMSVYLHSSKIIEYFRECQSLEGYTALDPVVGSCKLYVDFDNQEEAAYRFKDFLIEDGIGYKMYDTGNRGYHFHIDRTYVESEHLPYSDKKYIEQVAPLADASIYKTVGVYRIPGTTHSKTGKEKILIEEHKGKSVDVPIITKPKIDVVKLDEVIKDLNIFSSPTIFNSVIGFSEGNRHLSFFKLISALKDRGMNNEFIYVFVKAVNYQSTPPLDEQEFEKYIARMLAKFGG